MFKRFLTRPKKFVGVELGKEKIKVAVIEWNGKLNVCSLSSAATPSEWNEPQDEEGDNGNLVAALCQAADEAGVMNEKIFFTIEGNQITLRHIKIPFMSKRELAKAVKWEMNRLFPDLSDEIIYRYLVLGRIDENHRKYLNVLLITVKKKLVIKYYNIFQACGLKLTSFDISALALWRLYKDDYNENVALVYLSNSMAHMIVMKDNQINFIRSFSKYNLQNLLKQLEITLQYFKHNFSLPAIQRLILSGKYNEYNNILTLVEKKTGIPAKFGSPSILKHSVSIDPDFEVALGLALGGVI
ncbi:type IV pilus biogenesis protein PilM [Desulfolucanica intricata]|uniref:type IV pilus biogenesis protein PilM n=1 Tax=Desulfolucanica intricata TaxID=1285191 RepID=UPI00082AEC95|nr:pilus assembly protein PilM [Desulfolucanica intricata]